MGGAPGLPESMRPVCRACNGTAPGHALPPPVTSRYTRGGMANVYFDLTREFNAAGATVMLTSGQAVVFYRIAMMSKDGDWILRESAEACRRVLDVLSARGARYRIGAPLDIRWLRGGWSSHLEFLDPRKRRVRCDFLTRPPRCDPETIRRLFAAPENAPGLRVIDLESLIAMKQTQRAKDYVVIAELSRLLPEERELECTTDPDRIIALSPRLGEGSRRPPVQAARTGGSREDVVVALAREVNSMQERDRERLVTYEEAARDFVAAVRRSGIADLPLENAHDRLVALAERLLPENPLVRGEEGGGSHADAQ